jgi:hypothetical protein
MYPQRIFMKRSQRLAVQIMGLRKEIQSSGPECKSMNNTTTLLSDGLICPGLDLKAGGGESASAGKAYAANPGLLQSTLIPDLLMLIYCGARL